MVKRISVILFFLVTLFLVACDITPIEEDKITKVKVEDLSGSGTLASPYLLEVEEGESFQTNISVEPSSITSYDLDFELGTFLNGVFGKSDSVGIELKEDNSKTKLSLKANEAGVFGIKISVKDSILVVYVEVTVTKEVDVPLVLVESVLFATISEGDGSLESPYEINLAYSMSESFSFAVLPNNATNKSFTWEVLVEDGDDLVTPNEGDEPISVTTSATRITVEALTEGAIGYIKGTAADDSNVVVYLKVEIEEFTAVTEIKLSGLLDDVDEEADYIFETALFTTWDMSGDELDRKTGLMDGTAGPGGGQVPLNLTYWPNLYKFNASVLPNDASNPTLDFSYSEEGIFKVNLDGTYETLKAGTTIVTISSVTNPEVEVTVKVVVNDSLYGGILMDVYEETPVSSLSEWNFDGNPDNLGSLPLLSEWNNVFLQTNTVRGGKGIDGNQKIFYLGESNRVYGIALESRVDNGNLNLPTSLVWNKVLIGSEATTLDINIGNNDKVHNEYRIVMVTENKDSYVLQDWTKLLNPESSSRVNDILIPEEVKGKTVALVIEQRLTEKNNNAEVHIKGIWLNQYTPVTGISLPELSGTYGQGAKFNLNAIVTPGNATEKGLLYSVSEPTISISNNGEVSIGADTLVGDYTITIVSVDDPLISEQYVLTVDSNVPTTSFDLLGIVDDSNITATFDSDNRFTDQPINLVPVFNEGASNQEYTYDIDGTSIEVSDSKIKFIGTGESTIVFKASGNEDLTVTLNVEVIPYDADNILIKGINETEALNSLPSNHKEWNTGLLAREWNLLNVDKSHGGSKIAEYGESADGKMIFEGHATSANFNKAINIAWIKLILDNDDNSFNFQVRSHDDDRVLESSSFRVLLIDLDSNNDINELIGWTTVASRLKQNNNWFDISLDISDFKSKEVIIVIEQTGAVQNNGNWPKNSDSAAGAYLHLRGLKLSNNQAPDLNDLYSNRLYARTDENKLIGTDWMANSYYYFKVMNYFGGAYDDEGEYNPLVLNYIGDEDDLTPLTLSETSIYINNGSQNEPSFYPWGLFKALNNDHKNNDVRYELVETDVVSLVNNVLTPIKEGEALLKLYAKGFAGSDEQVFDIIINVSFDGFDGGDDPEPEERTEWLNKGEILEDWIITPGSDWDSGVGEGVDLKVVGDDTWSSISYDVEITKETSILLFGARVFHREGETYPHFYVKVDGTVIKAQGALEDYVYIDTDNIQMNYYDLTEFIGDTVTIEIGIDRGTHAVITNISLLDEEVKGYNYPDKASLVENWSLTPGSDWDSGVGEGFDLKVGSHEGWSSIEKEFYMNPFLSEFKFSARVFVRDGETYPKFVLKVNGNIIRANGATEDFVYVESEDFLTFTYDLSSYQGEDVTIELGITTGTHAVIGSITLD